MQAAGVQDAEETMVTKKRGSEMVFKSVGHLLGLAPGFTTLSASLLAVTGKGTGGHCRVVSG